MWLNRFQDKVLCYLFLSINNFSYFVSVYKEKYFCINKMYAYLPVTIVCVCIHELYTISRN